MAYYNLVSGISIVLPFDIWNAIRIRAKLTCGIWSQFDDIQLLGICTTGDIFMENVIYNTE